MFKWLHARCDKQQEQISALYERQIAHLTSQLRETQEELAQAKGKISLMELAIMPLSSAAGAAYAEVLHPRTETLQTLVEAPVSEWQRYKLQKEQELEQYYADQDKSKETV